MKLAEALAARADATRRVEQLRSRVVDNARYQEGDAPAEDAGRLLAEVDAVRDDVRDLTVEHLGACKAVLVLDETGDFKKGTRTVGVR